MRILFQHCKELLQVRTESTSFLAGKEMNKLPTIKDAYLLVEDGLIADFGLMRDNKHQHIDEIIDASGRMILPTWCDSHTHLVYAGNREQEFIDRIHGKTYEEIANNGGGILNSAKLLLETSEEDLYEQSRIRLEEIIALGTGAVEIKSGYGLTPAAELKMLAVIQRLKKEYDIPIRSTFLAAHALPLAYKDNKADFLKQMIDDVLPTVAEQQLADFIDVFCETGYFSVDDMELMMEAGKANGLEAKVHVNQFTSIGGVKAAVKHEAKSVDHLEVMKPDDIDALKDSQTMPTALPGCSYFLGIPYTPARQIIDAGLPLALASDYNPGSAPSGNMNAVVSAACIKMKMTPEEAINAATINSAYAMGLESQVGSITIGKQANIILTKKIHSYAGLPYAFGSNQIEQVYLSGKKQL